MKWSEFGVHEEWEEKQNKIYEPARTMSSRPIALAFKREGGGRLGSPDIISAKILISAPVIKNKQTNSFGERKLT